MRNRALSNGLEFRYSIDDRLSDLLRRRDIGGWDLW